MENRDAERERRGMDIEKGREREIIIIIKAIKLRLY